jgi:hypothetical protein
MMNRNTCQQPPAELAVVLCLVTGDKIETQEMRREEIFFEATSRLENSNETALR